MEKILSLVISLAAIGFIIWWFFGKRKASVQVASVDGGKQRVQITVDGGYLPQTVQLKAGTPAQLVFTRLDPSGCLEELVIPDFGISKTLPVNQQTIIEIKPDKPGVYKYTCGMHMFSGQVVVK